VSARPEKILALQFKYFGDAVLMTPALRALREYFPRAEIHLLVPGEMAPLFQHLPGLNRIWAMPRKRGQASLRRTWPMIRALRRERFDRSVDFVTNDRGAIASLLIGARQRLGLNEPGGFWGRRFFYNQHIVPASLQQHETLRLMAMLSAWKVPAVSPEIEIQADPGLAPAAAELLPSGTILCHLASSQPKKEWPVRYWAEFYQLATAAGHRLAFTTPVGEREGALTVELKKLAPSAPVLPVLPDLALFLAVLKQAALFVSGDTGPLHFAAGLGVPTLSLFGPSSLVQWAPLGPKHRSLPGGPCDCNVHSAVCLVPSHCLAAISPRQVFDTLQTQWAAR
jgi:ADP-heptose:LPS heptosyltransferase